MFEEQKLVDSKVVIKRPADESVNQGMLKIVRYYRQFER